MFCMSARKANLCIELSAGYMAYCGGYGSYSADMIFINYFNYGIFAFRYSMVMNLLIRPFLVVIKDEIL